jgi:hypothetical protein
MTNPLVRCWVCHDYLDTCRPPLDTYHARRKAVQRRQIARKRRRLEGRGRWHPMAVGRVFVPDKAKEEAA